MTTQRRRLFALGAIAVVSGLVAAAACSFPEPELVPDEGGTTTDGPGGGDVDGAELDAGRDVDPFADVVEPDSRPPIDATTDKPFVDAAGCTCDCDKDGFRAKDQDASGCDASATKFDCDDLDPRAHPNAGFVRDQPTFDTNGDWNCDGFVTREVPAVNTTCQGRNFLTECSGAQGFVDDPGCGEKKSYVFCGVQGTACVNQKLEDRTQGCR